jgi:predicted DNA-binding protein
MIQTSISLYPLAELDTSDTQYINVPLQGGAAMTTQMMIRIDSAVKDRFMRLVRREGKTASQAIRDVLESYVEEHDITSYVDDLWSRMGRRLKAKKVTPNKITKAIQDVRRKIR